MKSLDLGTMFLVKGEIDELVGSPVFTVERMDSYKFLLEMILRPS